MKISYEQIEAYHSEIAEIIQNMQNIINDISEKFSSLDKNGIWSSPGAGHYIYKYKSLLNGFEEIYNCLQQSNIFLEQSYMNYKNTDTAIMKGLGF